MDDPVLLDGSLGEGGGQILRTALALSLATGRPFRIERVRAGRRKPGLLRQHLTAVALAAQIGRAEVTGAQLGSAELAFAPRGLEGGPHTARVGTAGSTSLVCQAVLPALIAAGRPAELTLEGGTHAESAPPFEFLDAAWGRLVRAQGGEVAMRLERPGFYPAGGGRVVVEVGTGGALRPLDLRERGRRVSCEAVALVSRVPRHVAERELGVVAKVLGWPRSALRVDERTDGPGPGNALVLTVAHEHVTEVFVAFGAIGRPAEKVARAACAEAKRWLAREAPVGAHLADQLMLPMVLGAGGVFRTSGLTPHSRTNVDTIHRFLPDRIETLDAEDGAVEVRVRGLREAPAD